MARRKGHRNQQIGGFPTLRQHDAIRNLIGLHRHLHVALIPGKSLRIHNPLRTWNPVRLQPLLGFTASEWDTRLDDSTERRHVAAPYHVTPIAKTTRLSGAGVLAALSWAGTDRAESAPWRVVSGAVGAWKLSHPELGDWEIRHWSLPPLA